ncbi:MAG TPA: hypothetical protein VGR28_08370 [Candidatus Thermoplasmatota archaeon]|nr:hypothetical protein [Candidatus Thermoplasmatota archaeon]
MVLILAISILGIIAVTNWGLPAIREMQTNVEYRTMMDQFRDLDATMQHLISGSAGQTTFKWQPIISQGSVDVEQDTDRWMTAADVVNTVNVTWTSVNDTDNKLVFRPNNTIASLVVKAWRWDGGAAVEMKVNSTTGGSCSAPGGSASANANYTFYLHENSTGCTKANVTNAVMSLSIYSGSTLVHRAFIVDVGHVHWDSIEGNRGPRHVYASNGGLFSGPSDALLLESALAVPPPRDFTSSSGVDSTSMFVRLVKFNGTASFSATPGAGEHYSIFLNLVGTYTLGTVDNVTNAYVYAWGDLKNGSYGALQDEIAGYRFDEFTQPATGERYLMQAEGAKPFKYTVVYSLVSVEGS